MGLAGDARHRALIRGANGFTADVVLADGRPAGKFGRRFRASARLDLVR